MADITKIRLTKGEESNEYNIADSTARNTATAAQTAASKAQTTATAAQTAANNAQSDINSLVYVQASVEKSTLVVTEKTGTGA